jgi:hypothetical protein
LMGGARSGPKRNGEKQPIPFLQSPHVCTSCCEGGQCCEEEGCISCFN